LPVQEIDYLAPFVLAAVDRVTIQTIAYDRILLITLLQCNTFMLLLKF